MVVPFKPPTQSKQVTNKGKAAPCPVTQLQVWKVTQVASPTPEVIGTVAPYSPVAGPSQQDCPDLLEDPIMLGDEGVGGGMTVTSGKFPIVKNTAKIVVQCSGRNTLCYNKITTCTNSSSAFCQERVFRPD